MVTYPLLAAVSKAVNFTVGTLMIFSELYSLQSAPVVQIYYYLSDMYYHMNICYADHRYAFRITLQNSI